MNKLWLASLSGSTSAIALLAVAIPQAAVAQTQTQAQGSGSNVSEVVVTGSRIRRTDTESAAPITVVDPETVVERGYTNLGQALNDVTSNAPQFPISTSQGFPAGSGKTSPNLLSLGSGRTLTLINGRRAVTTSSGFGDRVVDSSIIPMGLLKRVEIVNAGGAAIYGSDAIAGVVNYILRDNYEGLQLNAQYSERWAGNNPKHDFGIIAGKSFAGGRGNVAVDLEYSKTVALSEADLPVTASGIRNVTNPLNVNTTDGQPPTFYVFNGRLWQYNENGVIFTQPSGTAASVLLRNAQGQAFGFNATGNLVPYNTGVIQAGNSSTAVGGDGLDTRTLSTLGAGLERFSGAVIGHYDLTDRMKISGQFSYGKQIGSDPLGTQQIFRTFNNTGAAGPIAFNRNNPYLSAADVAALSAISPTFASGGNLYSTRFIDGLPTRDRRSETDVLSAAITLDGDFTALGDREFYYSANYTHGYVKGVTEVWAPWSTHLQNSLSAVRNASGTIVCSINADAITTNDDSACVPLNPFGSANITEAAKNYISALTGSTFYNKQDNLLFTLGGDVYALPGGMIKFAAAYEHREESVKFRPYEADKLGLTTTATPPTDRDASYKTNEVSGELLVPLLGGDFTLPFIEALEASGSYRYVDNSSSGTEKVWGIAGRWKVGYGLMLRATKSRNFRAPSLDQLFSPQRTATGQPLGSDPCDADRIGGGLFTSTRRANCLTVFTANPNFGLNDLTATNQTRAAQGLAPLANTPENRLAVFQDPAENTGLVSITSGGNPNLVNEVSKTTTYGLAWTPEYIPGLQFTADRIKVFLRGGFVSLSPATFASACYDNAEFPSAICDNITRNANGWITQGNSFVFNAGFIRTNAEIYNISYRFPIGRFFDDADYGNLELAAEGTHTTLYETQTVGFAASRTDDTTGVPDWRVRYDVRFSRGPLRLTWSTYWLPEAKPTRTATIETDPVPLVKENYRHSVSGSYTYKNYTLRAGIQNVFDEQPSFPTRAYGDLYGRTWFTSLTARY